MADYANKHTSFFLVKAPEATFKYSMDGQAWASTPRNERFFVNALRKGTCVLIFSANHSSHFHGYCEMISAPGSRSAPEGSGWEATTFLGDVFGVIWRCYTYLPFEQTMHLQTHDRKSVCWGRDGTLLPYDVGRELCRLLDASEPIFHNNVRSNFTGEIVTTGKKPKVVVVRRVLNLRRASGNDRAHKQSIMRIDQSKGDGRDRGGREEYEEEEGEDAPPHWKSRARSNSHDRIDDDDDDNNNSPRSSQSRSPTPKRKAPPRSQQQQQQQRSNQQQQQQQRKPSQRQQQQRQQSSSRSSSPPRANRRAVDKNSHKDNDNRATTTINTRSKASKHSRASRSRSPEQLVRKQHEQRKGEQVRRRRSSSRGREQRRSPSGERRERLPMKQSKQSLPTSSRATDGSNQQRREDYSRRDVPKQNTRTQNDRRNQLRSRSSSCSPTPQRNHRGKRTSVSRSVSPAVNKKGRNNHPPLNNKRNSHRSPSGSLSPERKPLVQPVFKQPANRRAQRSASPVRQPHQRQQAQKRGTRREVSNSPSQHRSRSTSVSPRPSKVLKRQASPRSFTPSQSRSSSQSVERSVSRSGSVSHSRSSRSRSESLSGSGSRSRTPSRPRPQKMSTTAPKNNPPFQTKQQQSSRPSPLANSQQQKSSKPSENISNQHPSRKHQQSDSFFKSSNTDGQTRQQTSTTKIRPRSPEKPSRVSQTQTDKVTQPPQKMSKLQIAPRTSNNGGGSNSKKVESRGEQHGTIETEDKKLKKLPTDENAKKIEGTKEKPSIAQKQQHQDRETSGKYRDQDRGVMGGVMGKNREEVRQKENEDRQKRSDMQESKRPEKVDAKEKTKVSSQKKMDERDRVETPEGSKESGNKIEAAEKRKSKTLELKPSTKKEEGKGKAATSSGSTGTGKKKNDRKETGKGGEVAKKGGKMSIQLVSNKVTDKDLSALKNSSKDSNRNSSDTNLGRRRTSSDRESESDDEKWKPFSEDLVSKDSGKKLTKASKDILASVHKDGTDRQANETEPLFSLSEQPIKEAVSIGEPERRSDNKEVVSEEHTSENKKALAFVLEKKKELQQRKEALAEILEGFADEINEEEGELPVEAMSPIPQNSAAMSLKPRSERSAPVVEGLSDGESDGDF